MLGSVDTVSVITTPTACCRGFWNRHKDEFAVGQVAQRLGLVVEVGPKED